MDPGIGGGVAVVTGGESGTGFKTAEDPLPDGVRIVLTGTDETTITAAAAVLFSCPDRAGFITGANLRADGGSVMTAGT